MSKRSVKLLLQDIVEALNNILSYSSEMSFDQFMSDQKTKDAVVRNFEIIAKPLINYPKISLIRTVILIGLVS